MGLFEELSRVYPLENVHPYGLVLIVPNSAFKPEWKPVLEAEGVQIYTNAYDGKVCFFLRKREGGDEAKPAGEPQPEAKPKPKPRRLEWTPQDLEVLRRLRTEGLAPSEIAERLGRSVGSVLNKLRELKGQDVKPEAESRKSENEALLTELLSAAQTLYPRFKRATALLLKEAARLLEA